jgi:hypothetical protein
MRELPVHFRECDYCLDLILEYNWGVDYAPRSWEALITAILEHETANPGAGI